MKFRTAILLGSLAVVAGVVGVTSAVAARIVEQDARAAVDVELARSVIVFEELVSHRQSLLAANAKVVAEEPRLKAVVATEEIDHATTYDVSSELRRAVGSDLFLLTDGDGVLLADTADPKAHGFELGDKPLVADALKEGKARGIWTADDRAYQMAAQRLAFGDTVVGVLVVGWELGDDLADAAARQTGGNVVVLADGAPVASSLPEGASSSELPTDAEHGTHATMTVDGAAHRVITGRLLDDDRFQYLVLRSLDEALATSRTLVRQIYAIGGAALLVAILLALWFSQRLSRPLRGLVEFTREIAAGHLERRPIPKGPTEIEVLGEAMNNMAVELDASRASQAAKERLEREMEIATRIQTSILPADLSMPGYSVAASMETASEVGGDYYDVIPNDSGGWLGIGDVAGHGLPAGLVMLMVQSAASVLVRAAPDEAPSTMVTRLNAFLFDNVRTRLVQDEHVTFTLLRCSSDGDIVYAGAHEEIVVFRKATGTSDRLTTFGPWLGVRRSVAQATQDQTARLEPGDIMLLYTDGVTEAMNAQREQFGMDRLCRVLEDNAQAPVEDIVARLREAVDAWCVERVDDITLLVARYDGPPASRETLA